MVGSVFAIPRTTSSGAYESANSHGKDTPLRDQHLRQFIAGPENALTLLAADSVADQWARFNPLHISGSSGVGKTHLLHCLLEASRIAYADLHALWLTGADYARAITDAIDVDSLGDIRHAHRSVDLFILDGLHELVSKPLVQQELVHTIDCLLELDGQIIVASRFALNECRNLIPSLASRLSGGLEIPLVPPASATRGFILAELAQQHDIAVPPPVSQRLTTDASRQRLKALMVSDLTAAIAKLRCVSDRDNHQPKDPDGTLYKVTANDINKRVAKYFRITIRELTGRSRRKTVVRARALSAYLIRTLVGSSFQVIGQDLGGRDHSTAMHAFQRAKQWVDSDAEFARVATEIGATFE